MFMASLGANYYEMDLKNAYGCLPWDQGRTVNLCGLG